MRWSVMGSSRGPRARDGAFADFGYREVPEGDKAGLVGAVFDSVADNYDRMNDLMSFGIHRLWKRFAIQLCGLHTGSRVLDLAGGSGDLSALIASRIGSTGEIVMTDINARMIEVGRARLADRGIVASRTVQCDAEALPFPSGYFDCVTIGFGLRNVTRKERALAEMLRVLKPGGRAIVLEFSNPVGNMVGKLYDAWSFSALPVLGRVVARDENAYRYLAESIRRHPDQATLKAMMETAGFERVEYFNLSAGIVAVHRGFRLE
jgi:demethylmenaquinone methyltransferase/2-methoxy-6-polyprenyl-1,4-benzoquinol methylase